MAVHYTGKLTPEEVFALVNLFGRLQAADADLTAALMALLEHSDPQVLQGLLERAGLVGPPLTGAQFLLADPDAPPGVGEIRTPHRRVRLVALAPGAHPPAEADASIPTLAVSVTGQASPGRHGISWEQLDRYLSEQADRFQPDSRTGFLLRQFRAFLPDAGIAYFAGFDPHQLAILPGALAQLTRFYHEAGEFFTRLGPALPRAVSQVREARPEDLLTGYCYRDYSGPGMGEGNFLRVAIHLGPGELQLACWVGPGGPAHARLRAALVGEGAEQPAGALAVEDGLLWLWSPAGEHRLPLAELEPGQVAGLDWSAYTVAVQVSYPLARLGGEGLVERVAGWTGNLLEPLAPILDGVIH